jgi:hypothetical protein
MKTFKNELDNNFYDVLKKSLKKRGMTLGELGNRQNAVDRRLLEEYGAIFLAHESVVVPPVIMFKNADAVWQFQSEIAIACEEIAETKIELQAAAMKALLLARKQAKEQNLDITPRGGAEAARRSFDDTVRLWNSRFWPALDYWQMQGEIGAEEIEKLKKLQLRRQVNAVLALETRGVFFSKDFSKSILYSVAAPGASQHLALLAFDANEFHDPVVRQILGDYGWFRTVQNDLPHFTFLGRDEKDLPELGLKQIETEYGEFWIPNIAVSKRK